MPDVSGLGGSVTLPNGINLAVRSWSGNLEIDEAVIPPAFGEKWEGSALGAGRFRGSLTAKIRYNESSSKPYSIDTTAGWTAFTGIATLTAESGCYYTGTFNFSRFNLTRPHGDTAEMTVDFRNAGNDLGITWDETP